MNFNHLASQIQSALTLYSDILLSILAASVLGWIVGLMMQRSRHNKQLTQQTTHWRERYEALEESSRSDAENLEEQLLSLAKETKALQTTNRTLAESLKKNDTNAQKSRAEAIELNRQHTETHERLQRIIQHKDREIAELGNRLSMDSHAVRKASASATLAAKPNASTDKALSIMERELNNADTVAISPGQLAGEPMDATVQMTIATTPHQFTERKLNFNNNVDSDTPLDATADLSDISLEESTIVMDDEAIAFAQRSTKDRQD